eukprot:TRINITY_DN1008_c0_g2_i3.p1 TRINITY_DN1008_c0_g2~~TRINITY_DN1008_c0_g2_i3.p1  ORF type:complete len:194 (-),score=71.32 TRINITY_DN1008_c0_g2_i3:81-662(-)
MGERAKVLEGKVNECNKQLNEVKNAMKTQKGIAYKNSQKKALMILKRRKMYEAQLNSVSSQQFNIDQVQFTSETIQTTIDTAAGMKQAAAAQKELMKKLDLDQLEDLQDDMQDMMEDQQEMQEILGRDYAIDGYDEAEIEAELEELDGEIVNEKLEGNNAPSYIPQSNPVQPVGQNDKEDLANIMNNCQSSLN